MRLKVTFAKSSSVHCPLGWTSASDMLSCNDQGNILKWSSASRTEPTILMSLPKDFSPTDLDVLSTGRALSGGLSSSSSSTPSSSSSFVLVSGKDGRFLVINKSNRVEKNILAHNGPIVSGRWSNDSSSFLTAGEDGTLKVWSKSAMLRSTVSQATISLPIRFARWSPNSNSILYATESFLTVKPLAPNSKTFKWAAHEGFVLCASWSLSGVIASGGEDCRYKLWDQTGVLLFQSPLDEHPIRCVEFSPDGEFLLVGSFNLMRLCNATGSVICSSFFNVENIGSVQSVAWAADGTQFVAETGSGTVAFASVIEQRVISRQLQATLQSKKSILLENILSKTKDTLEFSDRVTKFDIGYGQLVVALAGGQLQIFNENYVNTPAYLDGRVDVRILELGQKTFLLVDSSGIWIYSYTGRLHLNPRFPGYQSQLPYLTKSSISLGISLLAVRDAVNPHLIHVFDHLPGATRQDVPLTLNSPSPVAQLALSRAPSTNDQFLAFIDDSGDLYVASAVRTASEFRPRKIGSQVTQLAWGSETNILVTLNAGEETISVFYCPGEAHLIDPQLVTVTTETMELAELAGGRRTWQNARIERFEGPLVTLRNGFVVAVNMYAELLHQFAQEGQWRQCLKVCRVAQEKSLWGTLAAMATTKGQVEVAEEAFAAIPLVDKVDYFRRIRGEEGLGQVQANVLNGRVIEAETQLVNSRRFEEAVKLNCSMFNWDKGLKVAEEKAPQMKEFVEKERGKFKEAMESGKEGI